MNLSKKKLLSTVLVVCLILGSSINSFAAKVGTKSLPNPYGTLKAEANIYWDIDQYRANTYAKTTKSVNRIRATVSVHKSSDGSLLGAEGSDWVYNASYACTPDFETYGYGVSASTKLSVYGTGDAIIKDAYAVYVSTGN